MNKRERLLERIDREAVGPNAEGIRRQLVEAGQPILYGPKGDEPVEAPDRYQVRYQKWEAPSGHTTTFTGDAEEVVRRLSRLSEREVLFLLYVRPVEDMEKAS